MITYIRGTLTAKNPPLLTLEAGSLGYEIQASMQTFYQLPEINQEVVIHTYLLIKEEKQMLYGFIQPQERELFRELIKINSIGPKAALAILSNVTITQLISIIKQQDVHALQNIPGIGRKTAERLLLEMTNRLDHLIKIAPIDHHAISDTASLKKDANQQDAISALITLGYKPQLANQAIEKITQPELPTEELIKIALQALMHS